ncbi:radical SAM/SPASM domain-containing protein [Mycobacterium kansasii]|uniref:radical SAM/SPASM domain-containing protein n=1 Tax=Mycobacterium kansasii TaxID=1768 RepID=UPI000CDDB868|nr:radical SAM protein [Mycobacterium kansasii]POY33538.1 radical SAM/SPASM domain-containing protein [Mycobacterium kansasii]
MGEPALTQLYDETPPLGGSLRLASHRCWKLSGNRIAILGDLNSGWCIVPAPVYDILADFFARPRAPRLADADPASAALLRQLWAAGLLLPDGRPNPKTVRSRPDAPNALLLKLTGGCNIACTYCYDYDKTRFRARLDDDRIHELVDVLIARNSHLSIAFHGGEPLLRWDQIKRTVSYARERAAAVGHLVSFSIQTNGLFFTPAVVDYLERESFSVGISLDGSDEEANSLRVVRHGPTPLQAVRQLLREYPAFARDRCGFLAVATKASAPRLPSFALWLQEHEIGGLAVGFLDRTGRGVDAGDQQLTPQEAVDLMRRFADLVATGELTQLAFHPLLTRIKNLFTFQPRDLCAKGPCGAAAEFVVLDAEGAIRSCDCVYDPYFELAGPGEPMPEAGHSKRLAIVDRHSRLRSSGTPCATCALFGLCGGTCVAKAIAESGSADSVSSVECAISTWLYPILLEEVAAPPERQPLLSYFRLHEQRREAEVVSTCLS